MASIAIGVGLLVFLLTGSAAAHFSGSWETGLVAGLIAGAWAACPLIERARAERYNFLYPAPKEYNLPMKVAFSRIRDILAEASYNYGDKWHVVTADTQSGRIVANLHFFDENERIEFDSHGHIRSRKERLQRCIDLECTLAETETGTVTVQFDFFPKAEGGLHTFSCDSIISSLPVQVDVTLASGTQHDGEGRRRATLKA